MAESTVRTSLDIPITLHRKLHEAAVRKGCSARQLILHSIERVVEETRPQYSQQRLSLEPLLVPVDGRMPFDLTNEQIYKLIEFP